MACQRFSTFTVIIVKLVILIYCLLCSFMLVAGIFTDGVIAFVYYPGITAGQSDELYMILYRVIMVLHNYFMLLAAVVIVSPLELIFFLIFANMPLVSLVIRSYVNEFDEMLQRDEVQLVEVREKFRRFIAVHLNYQR